MNTEEEDDELDVVIVCSGPPYCELQDDEAVAAQNAGCIWCSRIYTYPDGREVVEQPGDA